VSGQCEDGPGAEGADSHFFGQYTFSGSKVSGEERWLLTANEKWKKRGGLDCQIRWTVEGTKTAAPSTCGSCAYGIELHAEPDMAASTCPEEMLTGRRAPTGEMVGGEAVPFDQSYGVSVQGDKATLRFAKSGKVLAEGYANADAITWVSDHACKWF